MGPIGSAPTGVSHERCYLRGTNACGTKITREHFISENILEKISPDRKLFPQGGSHFFGGTVPTTIGIDAFTAKVLCDRHNSALSPLDTVAGVAFDAIGRTFCNLVELNSGASHVCSLALASRLDLERWLVKVFYGLVAAGKIKGAGGRVTNLSEIHPALLKTLLDGEDLPTPLGIYLNYFVGQDLRHGQVTFGTIHILDGSDDVGGLILHLGGLSLVLITSMKFGTSFTQPNWMPNPSLAINVHQGRNRVVLLLTH